MNIQFTSCVYGDKLLLLTLMVDLDCSNFLFQGIVGGFYYHFQLFPCYCYIAVLERSKESFNIIAPQKIGKSKRYDETFYLKKV